MEGHNSVKSLQLQYFSAVGRADIRTLQDVLKHKSRFDVNAVNTDGKTAFQLAVRRNSTDVIRILLHHNVNIGDALFHAIDEKLIKAIQLILNHPQGQDLIDIYAGSSSEEFHPDTTPLILAAHHNNHDIIKLLIENGATPIAVSSYQTENHTIQRSIGKLNVYKALASEAYMCVIETETETKPDPFQRAFELCQELRRESSKEYEFREEYLELAAKCEQFSADLLGQTRDSTELKSVLSHDSQMSKRGVGKESRPMKVMYAVQRQHKKFVVHPHCQQHLSELWYRGLENWQDLSLTWNLVISTVIMLAFPVLGLLYLIYPYGKFGRFMRIPFIKFLMHTASYICFLVFLFLTTTHLDNTYDIYHESKIVALEFQQRLSQQRGSLPTKVEILIALWIIGMTWREICEMRNSGLSDYLANAWNILDLMQIGLYWVCVGLRTASIVIVERESTTFENLDYSYEDSGIYPTSSNEATLRNVTDATEHSLFPEVGAAPPNLTSLANTTMHLNMDEELKRILEAVAADVADKIMTSTIYQEAIANISLQLSRLSQAVSDLSDEERSFDYDYFPSDFTFPAYLDEHEFSVQRKDWKQYDPTLLADLVIAVANVISVVRFLRVVVINKYVGPLQISVAKMLTDIMKFMFIFGLVWVAFALGLTQVYWGYAQDRMLECIQVDQESYKECYEKRFFAE